MIRLAFAVVIAVLATAATAQAQTTAQACNPDYKKLCPDVAPGGGRIAKCLVAHKDDLSDGCRSALREAAAKRKAGATDTTKQN